MKTYQHTQPGRVMLASFGVGILVAGAVGLMVPQACILLGILALCGLLFYSLTVKIEDGWLIWYFGPGIIRKKISVDEIRDVLPVRNTWLAGWGIHYLGRQHGWIYNVSGFDAVEVIQKNGRHFRLGTDESEVLAKAIREAIQP